MPNSLNFIISFPALKVDMSSVSPLSSVQQGYWYPQPILTTGAFKIESFLSLNILWLHYLLSHSLPSVSLFSCNAVSCYLSRVTASTPIFSYLDLILELSSETARPLWTGPWASWGRLWGFFHAWVGRGAEEWCHWTPLYVILYLREQEIFHPWLHTGTFAQWEEVGKRCQCLFFKW